DIHNDSNVSFVTETNRNDIKLEQIVLPLPGYDIKYPLNDIHSWYRDLLNEDGIKIDQMKYQVKDYSLPGNYRQFIVRTGQVDYRIVHYDNMNDDPLQSDYDRLMNRDNNLKLELNKYKGLILAFSLPKSSYATMAVREILHRNESTLQTHHKEEQLSSTKETITNQDEEQEQEQEQEIEDVV
ncbi:unnamed protein product, partial [Rotaria magnacalcarata]